MSAEEILFFLKNNIFPSQTNTAHTSYICRYVVVTNSNLVSCIAVHYQLYTKYIVGKKYYQQDQTNKELALQLQQQQTFYACFRSFGGFHRSVARGLLGHSSCSRRPVPVRSGTTTTATPSRRWRRYGAQPAGGDVPVGRLRQVDAVPKQPSRRVLALGRARVAAENVLVVVEPPGSSAAKRQHVFVKPCLQVQCNRHASIACRRCQFLQPKRQLASSFHGTHARTACVCSPNLAGDVTMSMTGPKKSA